MPYIANKICGPTRGIGLEKLTKAKGRKLTTNVSPSKGRPTDPIESAKLSSEIGLMVRHHLPMNTKFKDITEGVIEESLSRVEVVVHKDSPRGTHFRRAGPHQKVYFDSDEVHACIVTCGGLCPGLNTVIREIVCALYHMYDVTKVLGIDHLLFASDAAGGVVGLRRSF